MAEAFSEDLSEISTWVGSLHCVVIHFQSKVALATKLQTPVRTFIKCIMTEAYSDDWMQNSFLKIRFKIAHQRRF